MGETYVVKNRIDIAQKRFLSWKRAFKLTALVIMPLLFVFIINIFDIENIIQAKVTTPDSSVNGAGSDLKSPEVTFDANDFIASESKYLSLLSRNELQDLERKNYRDAENRMKFDYSQTQNLSAEEKKYLEDEIKRTAGYLGYILGEPRYAKNIPMEIHFYSQDFLPKADNCTKMGGNWNEKDAVCLSSKNASPISLADNWNGSHVNKFTYITNANGDRIISSFEDYRINLAIGADNKKLKKLMNDSNFNDVASNDSCDSNGLQKTIAHELTHNYSSIIDPSRYDEAIAYYNSIAIQRIMADDSIAKSLEAENIISKDASGRWNISDDEMKNPMTVSDERLIEAIAKYDCIGSKLVSIRNDSQNTALAMSVEKTSAISDYQLAETLLGENEKMSGRDLAGCVMSAYSAEVSPKNVFIQSFDFPGAIASCAQGAGSDTIQLSQSK